MSWAFEQATRSKRFTEVFARLRDERNCAQNVLEASTAYHRQSTALRSGFQKRLRGVPKVHAASNRAQAIDNKGASTVSTAASNSRIR
jgi:hypothetical protein